jgi:hypothetical protein
MTFDLDMPAEPCQTLTDVTQSGSSAVRVAWTGSFRIKAPSSVEDDDAHLVLRESMQADFRRSRPCVTDHIQQQFLHALEQEDPGILADRLRARSNNQLDLEAVPFLHPSGQPMQGRGQAAPLKDRRAELDSQLARFLDRIGQQLSDYRGGLPDLAACVASKECCPVPGGCQQLLEVYLQPARDPHALPPFSSDQLARQGAHLGGALIQLLLYHLDPLLRRPPEPHFRLERRGHASGIGGGTYGTLVGMILCQWQGTLAQRAGLHAGCSHVNALQSGQ